VQKQFKSGFIYLFTGKAYDTENYEFGTFSRRGPHGGEVKKLLASFDRQSRRLRTQIEKLDEKPGGSNHYRQRGKNEEKPLRP
jgi:hypothetical protein